MSSAAALTLERSELLRVVKPVFRFGNFACSQRCRRRRRHRRLCLHLRAMRSLPSGLFGSVVSVVLVVVV